jgi:hypothetical protein
MLPHDITPGTHIWVVTTDREKHNREQPREDSIFFSPYYVYESIFKQWYIHDLDAEDYDSTEEYHAAKFSKVEIGSGMIHGPQDCFKNSTDAIKEALRRNEDLHNELDKRYEKISELMRAVDSAILNPLSDSKQEMPLSLR